MTEKNIEHNKEFVFEFEVRRPTFEDIPEIIKMAKDMHKEGALMPWSEKRSLDFIYNVISGKTDAAVGIIGEVGKPEAIICMRWGQYWYTDDIHIEEILNYVRPEFRKSGRAKNLIEYAKKCSRKLNRPLLIGVLSQERTEAKVRLYQRQLGEPVGAYFLYHGSLGNNKYKKQEELKISSE